MLKHGRKRGRSGRITASVNPFVPKPGTAYQWLPMTPSATIARRAKRLRSLMKSISNVYVNIKSDRQAYYQALLSLGDRRIAPVIEIAASNGGDWGAALAATKVDAADWVLRDRSQDVTLPWDIIDGGQKESFFRSEMEKSLHGESTLPRNVSSETIQLTPVLK